MVVRHGGRGPGHLSRWTARPGGGGWSFDDLGGALLDLFDFEDSSSLSLSGNLINSITGKKTGLVLAQAVSSSKPVLMPTGLNGRPCAEFDGMDDGLVLPSTHAYVTGAAPLEIWVLVNQKAPNNDGNTRVAFSTSGTINSARRVRRSQSGGGSKASIAVGLGGSSTAVNNNGIAFNGIHVEAGIFGSTAVDVVVDGIGRGEGPVAAVPDTAAGQLAIGTTLITNQPWLGSINCVLVIDATKPEWTPESQAALLGYLKTRGGIA